MKKNLLVLAALVCTLFSFAQTTPSPYPCVATLTVNNLGNGNGGCTTVSGWTKTGLVDVTFSAPIPAGVSAPVIIELRNPTSGLAYDVYFAFKGFTSGTVAAQYCYYTLTGNNVLSNGNVHYTAKVQYAGYAANTCDVANGSLPVNFTLFTAARNRQTVNLKWETAGEVNNSGFNIQRLIGNGNWETVAFVPTQAVSGNSATLLTYTFNDLNTAKAVSQYRIQQVDIDGRSKYSEIRSVRADEMKNTVLLYPNPSATGKVNVVFDDANGLHDVLVSDATGRSVKSYKGISTNNIVIEGLNEGFYSVQVIDRTTNTVQVEKLVIQKR